MKYYQIICLDKGMYTLATTRVFSSIEDATFYAKSIAKSRRPLVFSIQPRTSPKSLDLIQAQFEDQAYDNENSDYPQD